MKRRKFQKNLRQRRLNKRIRPIRKAKILRKMLLRKPIKCLNRKHKNRKKQWKILKQSKRKKKMFQPHLNLRKLLKIKTQNQK